MAFFKFWPWNSTSQLTALQRGNAALANKNYRKAIKLYLEYAKNNPTDQSKAYSGIAECYLRSNALKSPIKIDRGVSLVSEGDLASAEYYFRLAISASPTNLRALSGLSKILPKHSDERRELLERIVATSPGTISLIELGDIYLMHLHQYKTAYEYYLKAYNHNPKDRSAYHKLAEACKLLGLNEEAETWNEKLRTFSSNHNP